MKIEVLGAGCAKCRALYEAVQTAVKEKGIDVIEQKKKLLFFASQLNSISHSVLSWLPLKVNTLRPNDIYNIELVHLLDKEANMIAIEKELEIKLRRVENNPGNAAFFVGYTRMTEIDEVFLKWQEKYLPVDIQNKWMILPFFVFWKNYSRYCH